MDTPRIAPGGLKELGIINYAFCTLAGRVVGGERPHVFTTLGRQRRLFRGWLHFSARLMPGGLIGRRETELVILHVATRRQCDYELGHHRRLARRAGVTPEQIEHVGDPAWTGWPERERTLFTAVDQLLQDKFIDDACWAALRGELDEAESIELLLLVGQYDSLATTLLTLGVQPER